jgi:hypothetical protein
MTYITVFMTIFQNSILTNSLAISQALKLILGINEPRHDKNQHSAFATSMDPDQPAHHGSLIRIHAVSLQTL